MIVIKGTYIPYSEWKWQSIFKKAVRRIRMFFKLKVPVIGGKISEHTKEIRAINYFSAPTITSEAQEESDRMWNAAYAQCAWNMFLKKELSQPGSCDE